MKASLSHLGWHVLEHSACCAGQGYIWLAHRDPTSVAWQLACDSHAQWQELLTQPHLSPSHVEWQQSGSLLLAKDSAEAEQLSARQEMLHKAGVSARYLNEDALRCEEPALHNGMAGGLLVSSDSQLVMLSLLFDDLLVQTVTLQRRASNAGLLMPDNLRTCTSFQLIMLSQLACASAWYH